MQTPIADQIQQQTARFHLNTIEKNGVALTCTNVDLQAMLSRLRCKHRKMERAQ